MFNAIISWFMPKPTKKKVIVTKNPSLKPTEAEILAAIAVLNRAGGFHIVREITADTPPIL